MTLKNADDLIHQLETSLVQQCANALNDNDIRALVKDVFSLDELESMLERELDGLIGVGVGYQGSEVIASDRTNPAYEKGIAVNCNFSFLVILAVPVDSVLSQRVSATTLLTVLRKGILGSQIAASAREQRRWMFVQERPETAQSTPTMLYYTQVWRVNLPVVGSQ